MKNRSARLIAFAVLMTSMLACASPTNNNADGKAAKGKGFDVKKACGVLSDPMFEKPGAYEQISSTPAYMCDGSAGVKADGTDSDVRTYIKYSASGTKDIVKKITVKISNIKSARSPEKFFIAMGDNVAKMINDKPLPDEIGRKIEKVMSGPVADNDGGDWKIGDVDVTLMTYELDDTVELIFAYTDTPAPAR